MEFKDYLKRNWFWILVIGYFLYSVIRLDLEARYIEKNGEIATITVEFHKHIGRSLVAGGYFYVKNKRYEYCYQHNLPLGSTFKIKYNPESPEDFCQIDE